VLLTREVRWFFEGPPAGDVLDWFMSGPGTITDEYRSDLYDQTAALRGVGRKLRAGTSLDTKVRRSQTRDIELAAGLGGHVEDWVKVSEPARDTMPLFARPIELTKHIRTRRYALPREGEVGAGCEVELAEVRAQGTVWWTICFETLGPPQLRADSLAAGIHGFVQDSPLPDFVHTDATASHSYPDWIARSLVPQRMSPAV
jgi:hypothetical protein